MNETLKKQLDNRTDLQKHLFEKGFLITDAEVGDPAEYPFYGNWIKNQIGDYALWVYRNVPFFTYQKENRHYFMIGHAYNPFTMETDENRILEILAERSVDATDWDTINELTGVFAMGIISGDHISFWLDASGMQYACYGTVAGKQYIASHMQLIGDLCGLEQDEYVARLTHYKWYHYMMGNYMPGDLTCFSELKRVIPNTAVHFDGVGYRVERFYPVREIRMCSSDMEYQEVIAEACTIMRNTMALIPQKWKRPAISLTGGIDSNTTFAAANGVYEKYTTFSYISMYRESVDAEKAAEISERFGVPHAVYRIPERNEDVPDYDLYKAILIHNDGEIGSLSDSDARKKICLMRTDVCDVEVKSWVSETIRAYAYKYFGKTQFPKSLSPRNYTSLYKIFLGNRRLARETDRHFADYLKHTELKEHLFNYDESDFFVWEMMHGGKCGLNIGVMKSCFDITIPYNNRKLLDLLLRVPLKDRLSDQLHLDMKKRMNRELYDMNIRVINLNETNLRKKAIGAYFSIHSLLPY